MPTMNDKNCVKTSCIIGAAVGLLLATAWIAGCDSDTVQTTESSIDSAPSTTKVLRFSAIPDQNTTELKEKFGALANHLSEHLGVQVAYVSATDYKASVEMFKNGDIHLAWFGGLTGVQGRQAVPGARAIAQGEEDPHYVSYFIAHKDTGLARSDDFPIEMGKFTFTFGSPSSTSGRLMPEFFIRQHIGQSPSAFFQNAPGFSGNHDKTVELVESGQVQVGAVSYKIYEKRVASRKTDPQICKIIWKTPEYADYNFTAHPDLEKMFGAGFIDKVQAILIAIDDPQLLQAFPRRSLIKASNEDFEGIAQIARELDFLR